MAKILTGFRFLPLAALFVLFVHGLAGPALGEEAKQVAIIYGGNKEAGQFADVNGIKIYYEVYGEGEPVVMIHGNGGSIASMTAQIKHFSKTHQVIAVDSRGHGKSELGEEKLTYLRMADDYAKLLLQLKVKPAHVIGLSDGGIIGLLLGIHHAERVDKLAVMGANLSPGTDAVYAWAPKTVRRYLTIVEGRIEAGDDTQDWKHIKKVTSMLVEQPNISLKELGVIKSPVLVLAADNDIIREEHTVLIYQNIPKAHLCIFPGSTHFVANRNPKLFNLMVENFLQKPFTRPTSQSVTLGGGKDEE